MKSPSLSFLLVRKRRILFSSDYRFLQLLAEVAFSFCLSSWKENNNLSSFLLSHWLKNDSRFYKIITKTIEFEMEKFEKAVVVNFACQNCFQPIVLDESMSNLSVHHLAELARKFFFFLFQGLTESFVFKFPYQTILI